MTTTAVVPFEKDISWGTGTVGFTKDQIVRLTVVNVGNHDVKVIVALGGNPSMLHEDTSTLSPGKMWLYDLDPKTLKFDKHKRFQVRAFVRTSGPLVLSNLEVFDRKSGETRTTIQLQQLTALPNL